MASKTNPLNEDRDEPAMSDSSTVDQSEDASASSAESSCLRMLDRVRKRSGSVDPDWLFGDNGDDDELQRREVASTSTSPPRGGSPEQIGRFKIVRRIGQGGYGIVFLAVDPKLNRHIALKVPNPEVLMKEDLRARFLREGEAAASLSHPSIVTVHEAGQIGAVNYIASQFIVGGTLAEWLKASPSVIPPRDAAALMQVLAEAVQHAHSRGVLHRDIKPGNVLLDAAAAPIPAAALATAARLTDFGLARIEDANLDGDLDTTQESILGTPAYMSPEQAEGRNSEVNTTSDVYALGVILYELLVGSPPFKKSTRIATLKAIWCDPLKAPSERGVKPPADLEAICLKCLRKDQAERYPTAAAVADDLRRYLNHEPITARPERNWQRLIRTYRRNPLAGLVAALVVLLAVGSTIASVLLAQANQDAISSLEQEILARDQATRSEELAIGALYQARVQQARALRGSGRPGQRFESLKAIEAALKHRARLRLSESDLTAARNEIVAARALVDLRLDKRWAGIPPLWSEHVGFDPKMERYARWESDGRVVVRGMNDNKELLDLPALGRLSTRPHLRFSPDGQRLAICGPNREGVTRLQLWDLAKREEPLLDEPASGIRQDCAMDFSRDGKLLVFAAPDNSLAVYDLAAKSLRESLAIGWTPAWLRINPSATRIAIDMGSEKAVAILDIKSGRVEANQLVHPEMVSDASWSRDGRLLATGCLDANVYVWDSTTAGSVAVCRGHRDRVLHVGFAHGSDLLMSAGRDSTVRLWSARLGQQLLKTNEIARSFSANDNWLSLSHSGVSVGRSQVASRPEFFTIPNGATVYQMAYSPDGRLLACGVYARGVRIIDVVTGREVARLDAHAKSVKFSPDGGSLFVGGYHGGVQRWPLRRDKDREVLRVGAPEVFATSAYLHSNMSLSEGCTLAVLNLNFRRAAVLDLAKGKRLHTLRAEDIRFHAVSPDDKWIATGSWRGSGAKVWSVSSGEVERTLPVRGKARVAFSPDGKWLVTCSSENYEVWTVGDWRRSCHIPANGYVQSVAAFSADSRVMAVSLPDGVMLVDPASGKQFVTLAAPEQMTARSLAFSPDASQLAIGTIDGFIHVWRLDQIRERLAASKLDWKSPRPKAREIDAEELTVEVPVWSASSVYSRSREFAAVRAFDGSVSTRWTSGQGDVRPWVAMRWPAEVAIKGLTIRQAFDRIRGFRVQQMSHETSKWRDVFVAEGDKFNEIAGTRRSTDPNDESVNPVFAIELPVAITTLGIRVLVTDSVETKKASVSIYEIEFQNP